MTAAIASTGLVQAARTRRAHLVRRFVLAALGCLAMSRLIGWEMTLSWLAAYAAVQLIEVWAFGPLTPETERLPPWRAVAGSITLLASGFVFGALSLPLWMLGGPLGGVCAAFVLSAAVINGVVNTPHSRLAITLTLAPYFVYLITTPLFVRFFGGSGAYNTAIVMGAVIFFGNCAFLWKALEDTRASEAAARAESERKRLEAEAATAARSAFVATVSHELRTPISGLLAGAAELERTARDSAARSNAALIADAGRMMKALLDDLLDHSKLEAGRMSVETVAFDLRLVLAQTARFWGAEARKQGLRLRVEGSAALPQFVEGDPTRLRQILNNLISNAVKFTKQGSVTLRLSAWPAEDGKVALRFQVIDTGSGMDAEQLGRLFTPFDQTHADVARRHGGTGLGLAISRQLARLMGGHLVPFSVKDQGSTFTLALTLPLAQAGEAAPAPEPFVARGLSRTPAAEAPRAPEPVVEAAPAAEESAVAAEVDEGEERPLRVLVVDDHEINRRAVQLILQPLGCDITTASHGRMALEFAAAEAFDVIFMDVRMPEMDGRETTRRLRATEGPNQHAPVIAVTADTGDDDVAACLNAGMSYFVSKPLDPAKLLGALSEVLSGQDESADDAGRAVA